MDLAEAYGLVRKLEAYDIEASESQLLELYKLRDEYVLRNHIYITIHLKHDMRMLMRRGQVKVQWTADDIIYISIKK